ncbi:uncharacterized protein B0T15DRAFT_17255 [Chaetomium strumarium]|uniref:BZIP domain-containing protein n=1 Tax=Chaetomium strumarium TaxID=1170767 RepID=A0AAJ0M5R4_9PEZI|nr:hypothetical protein B0T15DRAFT_17255 [Chaetomium strumarium]
MAYRVASPEFRASNSQLLFQAASVPITRTTLQDEAFGGESMATLYQAMMPMEWRQPLDSREGYPYTPASAQWFQPPSFSGSNTSNDSFVSELPETDAVQWIPSTHAPGVVGEVIMPHELSVQSAVGAGYFLLPPEAGPSSSLFASVPLEHREWARLPDYQRQPTGEYGTGHDRKRRADPHTDADEEVVGPRKKRGRAPAPIQTAEANAALPRYTPIISRASTSDMSHAPTTPSPPNSATVPPFDLADAYYSGSHYQLGGGTATAAPSLGTAFTPGQTAFPESPRRKGFRTRRSSSDAAVSTASTARSTPSHSTTTSSTTTSSTFPTRPVTPIDNHRGSTSTSPSKPAAQAAQSSNSRVSVLGQASRTTTTQSQTRDRNRAAASRYRAKTQAALAQLEATEREVSVRRQSLLTCASQLRDELFRLKNELLRHAGCDCPLIQGYLSHAAEVASAAFRQHHSNETGNGSNGSASGSGRLGRDQPDQVVVARSDLRA